jgi:CRISPR-associated protein Cas2
MMVLITYDVNTETKEGKKRLSKVAKVCLNHGQRVQNSVFECVLDPTILKNMQIKLGKIIDLEKDSIRFYFLGNNWRGKIEKMGRETSFDVEGTLMV